MTAKPSSFIELIDLWKRTADFARAINQPFKRVYKWRERGHIGLAHWDVIIAAAREAHGIELTADDLYAMVRDTRAPRDETPKQDAAA